MKNVFNPFTGLPDYTYDPNAGNNSAAFLEIEEEAGETLSGGIVVIKDTDGKVYPADKDTPDHFEKIYGVTSGAIIAGASGSIVLFGGLAGLAGLTEGETLWLGSSGALTATATETGFLVKIGHALTSTSMFIDIEEPINRA